MEENHEALLARLRLSPEEQLSISSQIRHLKMDRPDRPAAKQARLKLFNKMVLSKMAWNIKTLGQNNKTLLDTIEELKQKSILDDYGYKRKNKDLENRLVSERRRYEAMIKSLEERLAEVKQIQAEPAPPTDPVTEKTYPLFPMDEFINYGVQLPAL